MPKEFVNVMILHRQEPLHLIYINAKAVRMPSEDLWFWDQFI
jgi:hypothetical protein